MNARPILETVARALADAGLEVILIGNAAAALQGAPVTTVDFDFLFRKTPRNIEKLKAVARALDAVILRPYYPVSGLFRLVRDDDGLQLDFMTVIDGVPSFASLRARSHTETFGGAPLLVEGLRTTPANDQPQTRVRKRVPSQRPPKPETATRKAQLTALKAESDRALIDMIRRLLDKPIQERTHFLRKRISYRGSAL